MAFAPSGKRVLSAAEKWPALRIMHEEYGVPLDVLKPLAICEDRHFETATAGWRFGASSRTMLTRMSAVAERQLAHFQNSAEAQCDEKSARALAVMAKTLETIANIEERLGMEQNRKGNAHGDDTREDDERDAIAADLEAQLAELVEAHS